MLLSNRWGKSEGDPIILQSLEINYACLLCLLSPILFMPLLCLFLGMRAVRWLSHVTGFCHPPLSRWCSGDSAAELWLRLLQLSAPLCWCCAQQGRAPRRVWEGTRMGTTDWAVSVHGRVTKHTHLLSPFTTNPWCNSSSAASSHTLFSNSFTSYVFFIL